jgi:hypothetical protein
MRSVLAPHIAVSSDDAKLVRRALTRDGTAFRTIMERYNRRLYRIARGILTAKPKMWSRKRMSKPLPISAAFAATLVLRRGLPASP